MGGVVNSSFKESIKTVDLTLANIVVVLEWKVFRDIWIISFQSLTALLGQGRLKLINEFLKCKL
jgi:hypothetical protein